MTFHGLSVTCAKRLTNVKFAVECIALHLKHQEVQFKKFCICFDFGPRFSEEAQASNFNIN